MPTVILLASDHRCGNAGAVAFYLNTAFAGQLQNFRIKLFNYATGRIHQYQNNNVQIGFDAGAPLGAANLFQDVCLDLGVQANGAPVSQQTFDRLASMTNYSDSMTTLDTSRLSQHLTARAANVIAQLCALDNNDPKCFVIAPNGRNIPARLLTFGHKLSFDAQNPAIYQYNKRHGGTFQTPHLVMTNDDTSFTLTEIFLCRAIMLDGNARYLGNCYGSQVMWVALGGGLTTHKRQLNVQHNENIVLNHDPEQSNDPFNPNINWNDGIYMSNNNNRHPVCIISGTDRHPLLGQYGGDLPYNTDFHHSFMLIASKQVANRGPNDLVILAHDLADPISNTDQGQQQHSVRVKRYAQSSVDRYPNGDPRQNRTWEWLGIYCCHGQRIYGFQGHPMYHVTQYSGAWNAPAPSAVQGAHTALNTEHDNTRDLVEKCLFG